jgi:protein-arginine kinase activator protein McsA
MATELTQEQFKSIVKMFNLKATYSWMIHEDKVWIVENWQSESYPLVRMTKTFPFDEEKIAIIPDKKRKKLLNKMLQEAVEIENYEFAAKLRDIINV